MRNERRRFGPWLDTLRRYQGVLCLPFRIPHSAFRIRGWRFAALLATAALGFAAFAQEPADDPLPLEVVPLKREELPEKLKGVLVEMPRDEFDRLRRDAARGAADRRNPPRLVEARYRATLQPDLTLAGTGQWKAVNPAGGPALLPLSPLNLAVRQARFADPDGTPDALLAEFDGRNPALLLEQPGEKSVTLDWSARADARPEGGVLFALEFPAAPVAVLELDLPAEYVVSAGAGAALSGPHPAEKDTRRLWKISCSNKAGVSLWVRRAADAADGPALVFARQKTTQRLTPEGQEALFQFDLEAPRPGVRVLDFEYGPELRPCDVMGANVESWQVVAGLPGQPSRLLVRLHDPLPTGPDKPETVAVRCLAPLGSPVKGGGAPPRDKHLVAWTSPGMRLARVAAKADAPGPAGRAVSRGETLEVRVHPDVRLEGWGPGAFRLEKTATEAEGENKTPFQCLTLLGSGAEGGARRPSARLLAGGVEFRARQAAWWQPEQSLLTLSVTYEVTHGQLFQLPVQLPPGWDIDRLDVRRAHEDTPEGPLTWGVRPNYPEKGKSTLLVDLKQPVTADAKRDRPGPISRPRGLTLRVWLHAADPASVGRELPFPDAVPLGARFREGVLAIDFDELTYQHTVNPPVPESEPEPDEDGPWGRQTPDLHYTYRGQPVTSTLLLRPRPSQVRARCSSEVFLTAGRAAVEARLVLEAEAGSVQSVDVAVSAEGREPWEWRVEQGDNQVHAERVTAEVARDAAAVAALREPLAMAALAEARPRGERWRIVFAKPLRLRVPLRLRASRQLDPDAGRWDVPLVTVPGAARLEGEATLHLAGGDRVEIETVGLREAPPAGGAARGRAGPWRTFRYAEGRVGLTLRGRARGGGRADGVVEEARLTTYAGVDGSLQAHFEFRAPYWPRRTMPVTLPPGARPGAAQVDGRWLPQLALTDAEDGGTVVELPVPAHDGTEGAAFHQFEVVYSLPARASFPWQRVASPPPRLAAAPLQFRQTWRLPLGVRPVEESRYRRLPGSGADEWPARLAGQLPAGVTRPWREEHDDTAAQLQTIADVCQAVRKGRAGQTLPLREVLELVREQAGKDLRGFVVDAQALEEAGVGPDTPVKVEPLTSGQDQVQPWEALGLAALPGRSAPLLTTRRRASEWAAGASAGRSLPETVEAAVAEAAANGHDPTARFQLVLEWCHGAAESEPSAAARTVPGDLRPAPALAEWAEWEALAGTDPAAEVVLVSGGAVAAAGLVLAALLCLAFWLFRRRPARRRLAFLLLWLGTAGVAVAWLPPALRDLALWPLLPACALAVGSYVVALRRGAPRKAPATVIAPAAATAGLLVAFFELPHPGRALPAAADVPKVYALPGSPDQPDRGPVLLPPKLRDDLQTLARPPAAVSSGAVLLSASYDGRIVDGIAEFGAVYQTFCLGKDATLAIPLDGVTLVGDVWLDGARALPTTAAPQAGFTLPLSGRGSHKVELRFRVRVTRTGDDRDVQFTAPRLLQNRLRLELPPAAAYAQAVARSGAEQVAAAGAGSTLEADLGRLTGPIHLRWLEEPLPPAPVRVQYKEAYLWDLRPDAASLSGLIHFNVTRGHALTLSMSLPPELDVRSVEPRWPGGGEVRLASWRVQPGAGGARTLRLRFQNPVSGEVLVGLDLVPVAPLPPATALLLPTPQGTPAADGSGYLGYRAHSLDVQRVAVQRLQPIKPEGFAPFWPEAKRPDAAAFTYCASFRREGGAPPVLRVQLRPPASAVQAVQEMRLRVDGRLARMVATAELTTPHNDLAFAEWELQSPQPLTISAVAGDAGTEVRNWSQSGNRLLVWLDKTGGSAKVKVTGWLPLAQSKEGPRLDLPCLRPLGVQAQQTTVRVVPGAGLAVTQPALRNLLPLPGPPPPEPEVAFVSKQSSYGGALALRPTAAADAQVFTLIEVLERKVTFRATVNYRVQRGPPRALQVRLRDWEGEDVQVDAPRALPPRERRRARDDRTWTLEFRPEDGATGAYRLTLSGSVPLDEAVGGLPVPRVDVPDAARVERWLAVAGPGLNTEGASGLTEIKDYDKALAAWPGPRDRLRHVGGRVWKASADGTLRLVARDRGGEAAPIRVLLAERSAAVADNQRWLHEAVYWLRHEAHTDLNVTLPAAARVVAVSLDGVDSPPLQPEPTRLWLPLPGVAGVRRVRLRWVYEPPEPLDRPDLAVPKIDGADEGPCLWTVHVSPGFSPGGPASGLKLGLARAAAADLRRADAQLRISRRLVEQTSGNLAPAAVPLGAAQRHFADLCRRAERTLDVAGEAPGETGPGGLSLREWLQQLRTQNRDLAQRAGFDDVRADAERAAAEAPSGSLPRRGVPLYGATEPDAPAPRLQLTADVVRRERAAWLASIPWVGGMVLVWVLSFFPSLLTWGRRFAPEQFAAAGAVVWLLGGPAVVVLFLLLVAVLARVLGAGRRLGAWLRPRPSVRLAPSSKTGSSAPALP